MFINLFRAPPGINSRIKAARAGRVLGGLSGIAIAYVFLTVMGIGLSRDTDAEIWFLASIVTGSGLGIGLEFLLGHRSGSQHSLMEALFDYLPMFYCTLSALGVATAAYFVISREIGVAVVFFDITLLVALCPVELEPVFRLTKWSFIAVATAVFLCGAEEFVGFRQQLMLSFFVITMFLFGLPLRGKSRKLRNRHSGSPSEPSADASEPPNR